MHRFFVLGLLSLSSLIFSCSSSQDDEDGDIAEADVRIEKVDVKQVAHDNNSFAIDLYKMLRTSPDNIIFSPYSISSAMSVPYLGSAGDTSLRIAEALHYNLDPIPTAQGYGLLSANLSTGPEVNENIPQLNIANSLWFQKGLTLLPAFTSITAEDQGAELREVSFTNDLEASRLTINKWVEQKTENKIQDLIKPDTISNSTRLLIVSAIYLKANWISPFEKARTQEAPFTLENEKKVNVPFMHVTGSFPFLSNDHFSLLQLPYKSSNNSPELSMILLLPNVGVKLSDLDEQFNADNFMNWISSSRQEHVVVTIPKFKLTEELSLGEALIDLGMEIAFTDEADFSKITGNQDLAISKIVHKAFISVDEAGTEAAAATGIAMNVKSIFMPEQSYNFTADRPFIFIIFDKKSETILFLGRLSQPK